MSFHKPLPEKKVASEKTERLNGGRTRDAGALRTIPAQMPRAKPHLTSLSGSATVGKRLRFDITCHIWTVGIPEQPHQETTQPRFFFSFFAMISSAAIDSAGRGRAGKVTVVTGGTSFVWRTIGLQSVCLLKEVPLNA